MVSKPTIQDIERLRYLYKDEVPVDIELWDTVGQEKYDDLYYFT